MNGTNNKGGGTPATPSGGGGRPVYATPSTSFTPDPSVGHLLYTMRKVGPKLPPDSTPEAPEVFFLTLQMFTFCTFWGKTFLCGFSWRFFVYLKNHPYDLWNQKECHVIWWVFFIKNEPTWIWPIVDQLLKELNISEYLEQLFSDKLFC